MMTQDAPTPTRSASTRRRFLGTAAAAISVGLAGCGSALEAGAGSEAVAAVTLDGAPNGLQKYRCTVEQDGDVPITAVEPELVDSDEFQVINGGVDSPAVVARAADISESVEAFEETRTLFAVTFGDTVDAQDLGLNVGVATNDEGESIPRDRLSLSVE
jgi:hypothetical protein